LLTGQHLVEDVACTEDIALLIVNLSIGFVELLHVDLGSGIDGRTLLEGLVALLDIPSYPKISNSEFIFLIDQEIIWFQISMEQF
jgi:hypothetical protein